MPRPARVPGKAVRPGIHSGRAPLRELDARWGWVASEWVFAVDGKVMRGAWTSEHEQVTMFSAMLHDEAVTIAQVRVSDGTNVTTEVRTPARAAGRKV